MCVFLTSLYMHLTARGFSLHLFPLVGRTLDTKAQRGTNG